MPQTENKAACSAEERQMQKEEDEQGLETIKFVIAGNPDLTDIHRSIDVNFSTTTGGNLIKQVFSEEIEVGWNVRLFCAGRPVLENETLTHARVPRDSFLHAFLANLPPKKEKKPADGAVVKQVPVAQPASVDREEYRYRPQLANLLLADFRDLDCPSRAAYFCVVAVVQEATPGTELHDSSWGIVTLTAAYACRQKYGGRWRLALDRTRRTA
eukprot:CAMPEP_0178994430 /NCGR_PEP_ID=MMETSP0795-20121207/7265_1 /TAXON_ID=88552 /ORGANISM="Amoebophrya sp., Strain Ameob2" /LENGTH=212 /DNA_ID=CAMNT_0020686621 /DNA_START=603 /DNA_END=1242 /DNA_ORIENTATION=-